MSRFPWVPDRLIRTMSRVLPSGEKTALYSGSSRLVTLLGAGMDPIRITYCRMCEPPASWRANAS